MLFVTGTKRSGTSMWMQVLRAAGLPVIGTEFPRDWGEVIRIQDRDDDGVPTSASVQPVVLVDEVLRSERGIEDQFGIKLVAYRPGFEAEVVEQMESTRANQPQEISAR